MNQIKIMAAMVLSSTLAAGCSSSGNMRTEQETVGMANPASLYCANKGGKSVVLKDGNGGEYAICHFPDGSQIEEWALFRRGDHPQAQTHRGCRDAIPIAHEARSRDGTIQRHACMPVLLSHACLF